MKKVKKTLAVALTFAMTVVMVPQSALAAKKQVKLNKKSVSVAVGKTVKVKLKNNKKKVKWTVVSGKKNVALSKKGKTGVTIKGKRVGKAKVQAKIGKKKYVCTVTVTNKNKAQTTVAKKTAAPGNTTGTTAGSISRCCCLFRNRCLRKRQQHREILPARQPERTQAARRLSLRRHQRRRLHQQAHLHRRPIRQLLCQQMPRR